MTTTPYGSQGQADGDQDGPVVEHATAVVVTDEPDGGVRFSRIDGTFIGPRSIVRPHALRAEPEAAPGALRSDASVNECARCAWRVVPGCPDCRPTPDVARVDDLPARFDAAADALTAAEPYSCAGGNLRSIAVALRLMTPEIRAAVAAALDGSAWTGA